LTYNILGKVEGMIEQMSSNRRDDFLNQDDLLITVEVNPPKGIELEGKIKQLSKLSNRVAAVNVTDNPMANLAFNATIFAHHIQEELDLTAISHLTCRDKNLLGLQSDLLAANTLGVDNFLVLTGDDPKNGDLPDATGVFDLDSVGLVELITRLNEGFDAQGNSLTGRPKINPGVAVNPTADNLSVEIKRLNEKVEAGAKFIQTQPVYDVDSLFRFLDYLGEIEIPILVGILPLKNEGMADYFNKNVPGIKISKEILARMRGAGLEEGIRICQELVTQIKDDVDGIHIMPVGGIETANQIIAA